MNDLQIFENPEFGKIRTLEEDGKVLFCGKDVAKALGYSNPRDALSRHCRGVVKRDGVSETVNQHGKATEQIVPMSFIPESDVYRLITHSKLETAQRFEAWVFEEVLPAIRKTGGYQLAPAMSQQQKQLDALQKIQFILDVQAKRWRRIGRQPPIGSGHTGTSGRPSRPASKTLPSGGRSSARCSTAMWIAWPGWRQSSPPGMTRQRRSQLHGTPPLRSAWTSSPPP